MTAEGPRYRRAVEAELQAATRPGWLGRTEVVVDYAGIAARTGFSRSAVHATVSHHVAAGRIRRILGSSRGRPPLYELLTPWPS